MWRISGYVSVHLWTVLGLTDVSILMTCDLPDSPLIFLISFVPWAFCTVKFSGGMVFRFLNNCGCWDCSVKGSGWGLVGAAWEPRLPYSLRTLPHPQLPPLVCALVSVSPAFLPFWWWYSSDSSLRLLLDNSWHFSCGLPSLLFPQL